jgi:hypothetical protein
VRYGGVENVSTGRRERIRAVAEHAESEYVRLEASKAILDRAGVVAEARRGGAESQGVFVHIDLRPDRPAGPSSRIPEVGAILDLTQEPKPEPPPECRSMLSAGQLVRPILADGHDLDAP